MSALPPRIPSREVRRVLTSRRKRRLSFDKPFMANRKPTPMFYAEWLVIDMMRRVNPSGCTCCFYHAGLKFFQNVILQMIWRPCNHAMCANLGWQCQSCFTLQQESDAGSDDDEHVASTCELCGLEHANSDSASIVIQT